MLRTVLPNNSIFHFSLPERFPISSLHLSAHSSSLTAVFLPVPLSSRFRLLILVPTFKKKGSSIKSLQQKWEIFILKLDDREAADVCASDNDLIFFFCHQLASDCLRSQAEIEQTRSNIRREENYFKDFSQDQIFFCSQKDVSIYIFCIWVESTDKQSFGRCCCWMLHLSIVHHKGADMTAVTSDTGPFVQWRTVAGLFRKPVFCVHSIEHTVMLWQTCCLAAG